MGGVMTKIIERNTTIPARRTETFSTAEDNQSAVDVVVLQGERELAGDNRLLARFRLEDIPPAPRGVPQIEVTFDIDANGILHVSARDQQTGREQTVTISDTSNLDQAEIERMVREAEEHRGQDAQLRVLIDARNELDSIAHAVDRRLAERGERVPTHERSRAEILVSDAREAIRNPEIPLDRLRSIAQELQQVYHGLEGTAASTGNGSAGSAGAGSSDPQEASDEDVIDAEFTSH
jgi:molecular chaperone DnaK